ncbi:MAG: DOMON-like domain-containing protein [Steroidobacteraceae bacterium]
MTSVQLTPHPDSPAGPVRSLEAQVRTLGPAALSVQFILTGPLGRLRIPTAGPAERTDELWRHTCFETFVRREDAVDYLEFNFAPSGAWQAYRFGGYRAARELAELPAPPHLTVGYRESGAAPAGTDDALLLEAIIVLPAPFAQAPGGVRLGLSAVLEEGPRGLSYWALGHAPGRADFHHPDAAALTLEWT